MLNWLKKISEAIGHWEAAQWIVHTEFFRTFLGPSIMTSLTAYGGYLDHQPVMWILMASALAYMATMQGLLRTSEYIERKSPLNKLVYEGTFFTPILNEADVPQHLLGNREQRRAQRQADLPVPRISANQLMVGVNRTLARGQVSITIKNTATFPISWYLLDADTEINGIRAARVDYPSAKFKLLPGSSVRISDGVIDMDNIDCQHLLGKMNFKIRYGLPGKEHFELKFLANLNVPMERFGFVPSTITEWLA